SSMLAASSTQRSASQHDEAGLTAEARGVTERAEKNLLIEPTEDQGLNATPPEHFQRGASAHNFHGRNGVIAFLSLSFGAHAFCILLGSQLAPVEFLHHDAPQGDTIEIEIAPPPTPLPRGDLSGTSIAPAPKTQPASAQPKTSPQARQRSRPEPKIEVTAPALLTAEPEETPSAALQNNDFAASNPYATANFQNFASTRKGLTGETSGQSSPGSAFGVKNGGSTTSQERVDALKKWHQLVRTVLARGGLKNYPRRAQRLGIEGQVRLKVSLDAEGHIDAVSMLTGDSLLASAAQKGVLSLGKIPAPPRGAGSTTIIVPIVFQLH
ncbi:MAG: TonB family protein, partial [Polyangiaceae bacterium]|nr:TonB family protein [Polyangiaceae bacterium]